MSKLVLAAVAALSLSVVSSSASLAASAAAPSYAVSNGMMVATFDVPAAAKISAWSLQFEYKTQCENDHSIELVAPSGQGLTIMDRGLKRCSGRSQVFTGGNTSKDIGMFVGSSAAGTWKLTFRDLDKDKYTGALTKFRMQFKFADGTTKPYTVSLKGLPKKVPNP